jgi:hypothetical protein
MERGVRMEIWQMRELEDQDVMHTHRSKLLKLRMNQRGWRFLLQSLVNKLLWHCYFVDFCSCSLAGNELSVDEWKDAAALPVDATVVINELHSKVLPLHFVEASGKLRTLNLRLILSGEEVVQSFNNFLLQYGELHGQLYVDNATTSEAVQKFAQPQLYEDAECKETSC